MTTKRKREPAAQKVARLIAALQVDAPPVEILEEAADLLVRHHIFAVDMPAEEGAKAGALLDSIKNRPATTGTAWRPRRKR